MERFYGPLFYRGGGAEGPRGSEVVPRVAVAGAPQGRLGDQVGRREARPAAHTGLEEDR